MKDAVIADTILSMIAARAATATICPSEVARALATDEAAWRELMPQIRGVAAHLAARGLLRVTRGGVVVDATAPGGPIRLGAA